MAVSPAQAGGTLAPERAPLTDDPVANARHIKETAYFLRADLVGICELPPYRVTTTIKVGTRIDREQTMADKVRSVQTKLAEGGQK